MNRYSILIIFISINYYLFHNAQLYAQTSNRENTRLDTTIRVNFNAIPFEKALQIISEKSGLQFNYNHDRIPAQTKVTLDSADMPVRQILNELLNQTQTQLIQTQEGHLIIIPRSAPSPQKTGRIQGTIFDQNTGIPLAFANLLVDGTRLGAASNDQGEFEILRIPPGSYRVIARMLGYKDKIVREILVQPGKSTNIQVLMEARPVELDVVTVTGLREKRLAEQLIPGVKSIRTRDIMQSAGMAEDVFRTIQSLPGVVARSDVSSQFYVRGGTPDQNLIIVDDVPVFNPYRLKLFGGPISMFNPDVIEYVELQPGGFPAQYGDKLSAVLIVQNKEGNRFKNHMSCSASLIDAKLFAEGPVPSSQQNGSWLFSTRRTYYDLLFNQLPELPKGTVLPHFQDIQAKLVCDLSPSQKLRINILNSQEGMKLKDMDVEDQEDREFYRDDEKLNLKNSIDNRLISVGWINAISDITLSTLTLSQLRDNWLNKIETQYLKYNFNIDMNKLEIREDMIHVLSRRHTLQAGLEVTDYIPDILAHIAMDSTRYYEDNPADRRAEDNANIRRNFRFQNASTNYGFYIQDEWKALPPLFGLLPGIRLDYSSYSRKWVTSPRLSGTWQIHPNLVLHCGWGVYYQSPNFVSLFERFEREVEWNLFETISPKPEKAVHYIAGLEWEMGQQFSAKLDAYYKQLKDIITISEPSTSILNNKAEGFAYGFEAFLQKQPASSNPFSGWISYSYGVTKEKESEKMLHYRDFDLTHSLNLVFNWKFFEHFSLETQYKYSTGFPWTPIEKDPWGNPIFDENGNIMKGPINSKRNPYYSRLDVRFSYQNQFRNGLNLMAYIEVMNVLNRKNVYKYYWSEDYHTRLVSYQLPLIPSFGLKFDF